MKKILYITKNELRTLFFSPIAWLMLVLFLVLSSVDYMTAIADLVGAFERGGYYLMFINNLTDTVIANPQQGFFYHDVLPNLRLFFPLITMGLISRKLNNGTIKLLYSSPVRIREIILGKFLAMVGFSLILMLILSFTLMGLSASLARPDYGHIFAAIVGLFLLLCTYGAIGLFVSSFTSYQIVAAIATIAVLLILSKIGGLWQDVESLRNITFYLNIQGRSSQLIAGLLNVRDVVYFLILTGTFIGFTIIRLKSNTESISLFKKIGRYALVLAAAVILGFVSTLPQVNGYADTTRDKLHTITPPTRAMLAKLNDGPLEINVFWNLLDINFYNLVPENKNSVEAGLWEPYLRYKPDIHFNYKYYYDMDTTNYRYRQYPGKTKDDIAKTEARTYKISMKSFLTSEEVKKLVDVKGEEYRCFFELKYKGKSTILRVFDDSQFWPSENEIAAAINRLVGGAAPKIGFLTDELERGPFSENPREYSGLTTSLGNRNALINQGYDFDTISLKGRTAVPAGLAALMIADPRTPFSPESMAKIKDYIAGGGNLVIAGEPDRREVLQPLLDQVGVSIHPGQLIQPNEKFSSDCIFSYMSNTAKNLSPIFNKYLNEEGKYYSDSVFRVALNGASALDYTEANGFHIMPLLYTDDAKSWNRVAPINEDLLRAKKIDTLASDERRSFPTSLLLQRQVNGKEQRIIVAGDADYLTQMMAMGWNPKRYNAEFGFFCMSYFSYGAFPANTIRPQTDDKMSIGVGGIPPQKLILYYILPGIIAILGSVILICRRRK